MDRILSGWKLEVSYYPPDLTLARGNNSIPRTAWNSWLYFGSTAAFETAKQDTKTIQNYVQINSGWNLSGRDGDDIVGIVHCDSGGNV